MNMRLEGWLEAAIEEMKEVNPVSIYLYGSAIRVDENGESDIDILIIIEKPDKNLDKIRDISKKNPRLDITIIRVDEVKNGAHAGFNSFYFFNVLYSSVLLYGEDVLPRLYKNLPTIRSALWRVQCISQRMRNIEYNSRKREERDFWFAKFRNWIKLCVSEYLLTVRGIYTTNLEEACRIFDRTVWKLETGTFSDLLKSYERLQEAFLSQDAFSTRIRNGVFIVPENNGKYLLLKRSDGLGWEFPKGGTEECETFSKAALRELSEETGIEETNTIITPVVVSLKFPTEDIVEMRVYRVVIVPTLKNPTLLDPLFSDHKWMGYEDALKAIYWDNYKEALVETHDWINKLKVRGIIS